MRKQREVPDKLCLGQLPSMTKLYPVSAQIEKVFLTFTSLSLALI
jgi:hypothetical protein